MGANEFNLIAVGIAAVVGALATVIGLALKQGGISKLVTAPQDRETTAVHTMANLLEKSIDGLVGANAELHKMNDRLSSLCTNFSEHERQATAEFPLIREYGALLQKIDANTEQLCHQMDAVLVEVTEIKNGNNAKDKH